MQHKHQPSSPATMLSGGGGIEDRRCRSRNGNNYNNNAAT
jgi:hypothetical protein